MRRLVAAAVLTLALTAAPAAAQTGPETTTTLQDAVALHERPDGTSAVKATLPAGMQLTVLSRQEGWWAVSVSQELSGWIQALDAPARSGSTRSTPPAPSSESSGSTASTPAPPASRATPPPPSPRSAPPPPAREAESSIDGQSSGGLYDVHSWKRLHFDTQTDVQAVGFQYGLMITDLGELEGNLIGSRSSFGSDDVWALDLRLRYAIYALQPTDELPVGAYGALLGAFQRYFPPEGETDTNIFTFDHPTVGSQVFAASPELVTLAASSSSCVCGIHENIARAGGEGGAFLRLDAGDVTVIPRVAYRWTKQFIVGEEESESFSYSTLVGGVEFVLGRFAPGIYVSRTEEVNLISIGLALPSF